jgi:hypothetical protein
MLFLLRETLAFFDNNKRPLADQNYFLYSGGEEVEVWCGADSVIT